MLIQQRLCELLLIVPQFVLIEVELLSGWYMWGFQLFGQNSFGIDAANPGMEQHLLQPLQ